MGFGVWGLGFGEGWGRAGLVFCHADLMSWVVWFQRCFVSSSGPGASGFCAGVAIGVRGMGDSVWAAWLLKPQKVQRLFDAYP